MTRPAIIINELDAERIDRLLEQPAFANSPVADALNEELDRAQMLAPEAMPHDVVTMNSRVKFRDLTSGEERVRTLVFPSQVTDSASQLSVLAPVGAALLQQPVDTFGIQFINDDCGSGHCILHVIQEPVRKRKPSPKGARVKVLPSY